jgi:hypothetical protein
MADRLWDIGGVSMSSATPPLFDAASAAPGQRIRNLPLDRQTLKNPPA